MKPTSKTSDSPLVERRKNRDRRTSGNRRSQTERRHDFRHDSSQGQSMSLSVWLRSKVKSRLGVDRRKSERRKSFDRRQRKTHVLLSREEISDLLSL
ncbi:MAG TPA: hypothetical protein VJ969_09815 [Desulfopila sp.]|nr:hypothetical protein [Desulfopila sp.]